MNFFVRCTESKGFYGTVFTPVFLKNIMALNNNNVRSENKRTGKHNNNRRADVRDNLDSRSNEEQDFKGKDITHNKKETESERKKV
jgi:hypothetical protein